MIDALFFDIDGTLVSFQTHEIPRSTVDALAQAKANGTRIYISTGRPVNIITNLGAIEHLIDGFITVNGAYCFVGDEEVCCLPIPPSDVEAMLRDARESNYACIVVGERDFSVFNDKPILHEVFCDELAVKNIDFSIDALRVAQTQRILQLTPFFPASHEAAAMAKMPDCVSARWHPAFTDITSKLADKGKGLAKMARHLGIDPARTMAFGDGGNDLAIIRQAGIGVAMGNALDALKQAADYVTTSVDENGIAKALRHFHVI